MNIEPLGDGALLVRFGAGVDEGTHGRVRAAFEALRRTPLPGSLDVVAGFTSVTVHYDPAALHVEAPHEFMAAALDALLARLAPAEDSDARTVEIPVRYGGADGPDLQDVAEHSGLSPREVVRLHAAPDYLVYLVGFAPGFPYLGGLDPRIACPRLAQPRTRVPAGSVGIAGEQTGVYPLASPGGWRLIGRTSLALFDPARDPPALLRPGDRVRFVPVAGGDGEA